MSIVIVTIYTFSFVFVIYSCDLQFLLINLDDMYLLTKMLFAGAFKNCSGLYQFLIPFFSLGTFYTDLNFIAVEFQFITC